MSTTILLVAAAVAAGAAPSQPSQQEIIDRIMRPVVVTHADMPAVQVTRDLAYAADDPLQTLDIYHPLKPGMAPVVLLVHGWADIRFRPKEWGIFQSWGRLLAARGMAAVMFNHRLGADGAGRADAEQDLLAVERFVQSHAAEYSLDPERIAVMLFSGGGDLLPDARRPAPVKAVVAYYPLLTRVELPGPGSPRLPRTLIVRAGRDDTPGLLDALDRYAAAALSAGMDLHLVRHSTGVHGFENHPEDRGAPKVIARTLDFLDAELRPAR